MEDKKDKMNIEIENYSLNENNISEEFLEKQKYYLIIENSAHKIIVGKKKSEIVIKCSKYEIILTLNDFLLLMKKDFKTIDELYYFIINLFEENRVFIESITINFFMKLILRINNIEEKNIELILNNLNNKTNEKNSKNRKEIKNKNSEIKEDILQLNNEIISLKNEIITIENYLTNNINNNNTGTPIYENENYNNIEKKGKKVLYKEENIEIKNIGFLFDDSYSHCFLDNTFSVFESIDKILYLIYTNRDRSIKSYDLNNNCEIYEQKNAHDNFITNFRHYFDDIDRRDLLLSLSSEDNNLKIWNIKNFNCLLDIKEINKNGLLSSACFLKQREKIYFVTSNNEYSEDYENEALKVYDLNGKKIREINNSNERTFFIDNYYDENNNKNYIITGNNGYIKSYDFNNNELFKTYNDKDNSNHISIIVDNSDKEEIKLIESSYDGNIRIWNFFNGLLIKKINVNDDAIYGICLFNEDFLFVGCDDNSIKIVDLYKNTVIDRLEGHNNCVVSIKNIVNNQNEIILISQAYNDEKLGFWKNNN